MGIQFSMKILVILALGTVCLGSTSPRVVKDEFARFKEKFGKVYTSPEEEQHRFNIFQDNYWKTTKQNREKTSYSVGITQFSDLTQKEFKDNYLGLKRQLQHGGLRVRSKQGGR